MRMKKETFLSLCRDLRPLLTRQATRFRRPVGVMKRVAIALWRLSGTCEYRTIGHLFGVGRSTAHRITGSVCDAIMELIFQFYIRQPSRREIQSSIDGFERICCFPQVVGAVDGTHIEIRAPTECPEDYVNRKGFHSIQLQAVVDSSLRFTDIFVGYPGSVHDARVFSNSPLFRVHEHTGIFPEEGSRNICGVDVNALILGDSAYPLLPWLMKPFPESANMSAEKRNFNYKHSSTRMVVERAFDMLKGRWRCLSKCLDDNALNAITTIISCCTLHNYCLVQQDGVEEEWLQRRPAEPYYECVDDHAGRVRGRAHMIRQAVAEYLM